jgi:uncharacterized NAD(P)/FAD-binding protein YdhS
MADIVASLDRRGHKGVITALSRHGQLPGQHAERVAPSFGNFLIDPSRTAVQLLCAVRETVDRAEAQGLPWQSVFDALREQGRGIGWHWSRLNDEGQCAIFVLIGMPGGSASRRKSRQY